MRDWFFRVIEEAHETDVSTLPLPSANFSKGHKIEIAGDEEGNYSYVDGFDGFDLVDDATIEGFLCLKTDTMQEVLQVLSADFKGGPSLTYHFYSVFEIEKAEARLEIYDVLGQRVRLLAAGALSAGVHQISWDGRDDGGAALSTGVYYYRLSADLPEGAGGHFSDVRKLMMVK